MNKREFINSEGEVISIEEIMSGKSAFSGQYVLGIRDDPEEGGTLALHLLDKGTIDWLLEQIKEIEQVNKTPLAKDDTKLN